MTAPATTKRGQEADADFWPTYRRLLGYVFRFPGRIAVVVLLSLVVGASLGSLLISGGNAIKIVFMDDAAFPGYAQGIEEDVESIATAASRLLPVEPAEAGARAREVMEAMRDDGAYALRVVALIIVGLTLVGALARYGLEYYAASIGINVTIQLNRDMFANLVQLSHRFYDKQTAGEIAARFTNDAFMVNRGLLDVFRRLTAEPAKIVACLAVAMSVNWLLTIMVFLFLGPLWLVTSIISRTVRHSVRKSLQRIGATASLVNETVRGMNVIKAFQMERHEEKRLSDELGKLRKYLKRTARAEAAVSPASEVVLVLGIAALLAVGAGRVNAGDLGGGDLVMLFAALAATLEPIRRLAKIVTRAQVSASSAARVFEVIDFETEIVDAPDAVALGPLSDAIRFEHVEFEYEPGQPVLHDVNLTVRRGEMVALVGFSGSGKSTIAKLVPRFYDPTSGRVTFDGVDLRDVTLESLRAQIGIVTQDTILFSEQILENIASGREDADPEAIHAAARAANAAAFIDAMPEGYATRLSESGMNLSGGQRQRLAIARAIFKDPPILILDEATSSLDTESEQAILRAIDEIIEDRTTLVIAHRLSTVLKADRIVVLDEGRIVEQGTHAELLERDGIYRRLYRLQFADPAAASGK